MKIKISMLLLILVSLNNMGAVCNYKQNNKNFFDLELYMESQSCFVENGIKLQYRVNNNIENESSYIKDYLIKNMKTSCSNVDKNHFYFVNNDFTININMWTESNYTHVEIILLNSNNKYNSSELMKFLEELECNDFEDVQYFLYYKGKIDDLDYEKKEDLLINAGIQNINILSINNGYTGVGNFIDGKKVNFALVDYGTGYYVIIGTPIIFMAY